MARRARRRRSNQALPDALRRAVTTGSGQAARDLAYSLAERQRDAQAANDIRHLNPRYHAPSAGQNGTVKCSCSGAPFSPLAFQHHLAGKPAREILRGVYVVGLNSDPWAVEQKGRFNEEETKEQRWDGGETFTDTDGSQWCAFEDEFQRRAWKCTVGPRVGEVRLDTRLVALPPERITQGAPGGYVDEPF